MYLKSLQLVGFKSFAERTSLEFLPGVTAIVGPNGCGKSNVSDAIRWVLGEQSAKALRGAEMADVIFNGTDGRKAIGMAEVSMTFAEVDPSTLSLPGVNLEFSEITITRRVYKDGTGEYLINRTPCRLRDIQGLFMDTGIGRSSYSMMAQGQIDQILSARPDDRRLIFEEAAGINKYKHQKKEALRKLEYTEQNLVRLTDIIKEVKRQIISLQRQAGKARRYKELFDELKGLDTRLARHKHDQIHSEIAALDAQLAQIAAQSEQFAAQVTEQEQHIGTFRHSLGEIDHAITEITNEDHFLQSDHDRHAQRISTNRERIAEFEQIIANHNREIAGAEEKIRVQEQDLARLNAEFDQIDSVLATEQARLLTLQQTLKEIDGELGQKNTQFDASKAALFQLESEISGHRNELAGLDQRKKQDVLRAERLSNERQDLEQKQQSLAQRLADFSQNLNGLRSGLETLRATLADRDQAASAVSTELAGLTETLGAARTEWSQKRERLEVLRQFFAAPDGRQTVGNIIEVDPVYGAAIEAALSQNLRTILADDLAAARQLLSEDLKNPSVTAVELIAPHAETHPFPLPGGESEGMAATSNAVPSSEPVQDVVADPAPLAEPAVAAVVVEQSGDLRSGEGAGSETLTQPTADSPPPEVADPEPVERGSGVGVISDVVLPQPAEPALLAAIDVVRVTDARFEPLVRSLLRNVVIVEDLDAALALRQTRPELSLATKRGELVSVHGVLSLVSHSHMAEIAHLTDAVAGLQTRVTELAAAQATVQERATALTAERTALHAQQHEQEIALAGKNAELALITTDQREAGNKLHTVMFELNTIEEQNTEERRRREEILQALAQAEARQTGLRDEINAAGRTVEELRARCQQANETVTEQRIAVGGVQHKRESIQVQREPITGRIRDLGERMETCRQEIEHHTVRSQQLRAEIGESLQKMAEIEEQRQAVQERLAGLQHQRGEVATAIQQAEGELRALRTQAAEAQQQRSGFDVALAQKQMELQNIKERVWQKYQVNIEDLPPDVIQVTIADSGPPVSEVVPRDTDWDAIESQVTELQTKLDAMGPVNVEAIQEYDELEERYKFLSQQHEDLVKAKEQLLQVIAKINTTTKQLFTETFEKIRTNFQQMFTEMFGGGKANLLMLDENDVLESGIEIVAKPPGKQLQSISLLSGGERTLTATSLLFAIYMVKPSPFCVLDELDAPLDESNINRFIRILQRFVELSQFVVITHNKRTIGMADALYGITMEEHGVSKVVSVKFSPREEVGRRQAERTREEQEDRIDGAAVIAAGPVMQHQDLRPHEEELGNELLQAREETVAGIADSSALVSESEAKLGERAPDDLNAEVQAAVAAATEIGATLEQSVAVPEPVVSPSAPPPPTEAPPPAVTSP